jgi:alpha-mannosidase
MYFEKEQMNRLLKDLKKYATKQTVPISTYQTKSSNDKSLAALDVADESWDTYHTGELWGGYDTHQWFRTTLSIPPSFEGGKVIFKVHTGHPEGWDITNPQFLCFINGELIQGLDVNHRETLLSFHAKANTNYQIALLGYSGLSKEKVFLYSELALIDELILDFYYDLNNLFETACILHEEDMNKENILQDLRHVISLLDFRKVYSQDFYTSLKTASSYIKQKYYTQIQKKGPVVTVIGHTHIDIAWMWSISQTREKVARSFSTVLYLMDQYPDYQFMSSQPQLYAFLKEDYPQLYEKVKQKIKEGRWEVDGGMWVEADCNLISGESIVRQLLHGTRFFEKEFGKKSHTLWLPDVFGYSAALPQLLRKSGIDYFFTTKLDWNQFNRMPHDTFMWRGIDGSEIFTHFATTTNHVILENDTHRRENPNRKTTYNGRLNPNQVLGNWSRYQDKNLDSETLQLFGFGDGGGGPTEEMLQNEKRLKYGLPGLPRTQMDFQKNFFDRISSRLKDNPKLPKWVGELYLEYHRGTYTSMAKNKRFNRKAEFLYQEIEMLASLAHTLVGMPYPEEILEKCWKLILINQFHDIIPGSSIEAVYEKSDQDYAHIFKEGNKLLENILNQLTNQIALTKDSIVAFNTLSWQRTDLAQVPLMENTLPCAISNTLIDNGPVQMSADGKSLLFLAKDIPAKGYKACPLQKADSDWRATNPFDTSGFTSNKVIETPFYKVVFDEHYTFSSLWDKQNNREILSCGERGNKLEIFEDRPMNFENWDIDLYHLDKVYEVTGEPFAIITETGPLRLCIEISRKYYDSTIHQSIYFYVHTARIDFDTTLDWHEKNVLLKVAFPVNVLANKARYEIQYGSVERPTHNNTSWDIAQFETCGHKWADLSQRDYGVSVLNDCKYGYAIKDHTIRLTLVKCGTDPNPEADQGHHRFTYSLYPHKGDWVVGDTCQEAYQLNVPLHARHLLPQKGCLSSSYSLFSLNEGGCILEAIKKSEDGEGLIIRIFEYTGAHSTFTLTSQKQFGKVYECTILEAPIREMTPSSFEFTDSIAPFEVKTYLIL